MDKIGGLKGQSFCTKIKKAVKPVGENISGAVILLFLGIMAGPASAAVPIFTEITPSMEFGTNVHLINFSESVSRTPNGSSALNNSSSVVAGIDGLTIPAIDPIAGSRHQGMLQSHGRLTANGMHFEINSSNYLNITLDSSEIINITLESAPKMVTIKFESASYPLAAKVTLGGFVPLTTYNKYEDNYHNLVSFQTDINGNYTYTQELSKPHFVFIQPETGKSGNSDILATSNVLPETIFIQDNATGGDCTKIGTWNATTKTCTLTKDPNETIQIDSDGITLNGNGHTITGSITRSRTGSGVYLSGRIGVTIENLNIKYFINGISLYSSSNNTLSGNIALNNYEGISLYSSSNNTLSGNNASNNDNGIYLSSSNNNTLSGNNALNNGYDYYGTGIYGTGIYLWDSSNNTLSGNSALNNGYGISLDSSNDSILINNSMIGNNYNFNLYGNQNSHFDNIINTSNTVNDKPIIYIKNDVNTVYTSSSNAGTIYCIWCDNITIKNVTLIKNGNGIFFWKTMNSKVENITASNNGRGIYLYYSNNNTLSGNNASNNRWSGISLYSSSNNTLSGNNASNNYYDYNGYFYYGGGISLYSSSNNTLSGNIALNNYYGISLDSSSNNMLSGNNASNNDHYYYDYYGFHYGSGIFINYSSNNTLRSNNVLNNYCGISLDSSSNNTLSGNNASNNLCAGISLDSSSNNMLSGNNANSNDYDGTYLIYSSNNTLIGNNASNNYYHGIYLIYSSNNTLIGNNALNNSYGISLDSSSNSTLINNSMTGNNYNFGLYGNQNSHFDNIIDTSNTVNGMPVLYIKYGANTVYTSSSNAGTIYCIWCNNVTIKNLTFIKNGNGIFFWKTMNSKIENITVSNNGDGISLDNSSNNTLSGNNASNNNWAGVSLWSSSNNRIYNNYFNDIINYDGSDSISNAWNTTKTQGPNIVGGPYLGGNFWVYPNGTGFSQKCIDSNKDGICDSPYTLDGNNTDYLPLAVPAAPPTGAPNITSFSPYTTTITNNVGDSRTFSITTNQTVNVSWLINGTEIFNDTGVATLSYTNTSATAGTWNVTAVASNTNGTAMQTWIWIIRPVPTGSISGFKINDTNSNGKWDAGENGISNWTIRLIGITGKGNDSKIIRKETSTDATGFYTFDNLPAGRYFVVEKLKKGFVPTSSPVKRIKLAQGENSMNNNFTNRPINSLDRIDGQSDVDDYDAINRDIDENKEDMDWD